MEIKMTDEMFPKMEDGKFSCSKCDRKDFSSPMAARMHHNRVHSKTVLNKAREGKYALKNQNQNKHINFCPVCGTNILLIRTVLNS